MISALDVDSLYERTLYVIKERGEYTEPRGLKCYELMGETLFLQNPQYNIVSSPVRKVSKGFMAAELVWMLTGHDDVWSIKPFNKRIANYSDDGRTFAGAYGPRLVAQLPYILHQLEDDPWTRQAVMTTWQPNPVKTKDVPCTIMFHFLRRPIDTLNLIVYMRSNDAWLGLPYDIHNFTCIQMLVAAALGLKLGTYTHHTGSLHLYDDPKVYQMPDLSVINDVPYIAPLMTYMPLERVDLIKQLAITDTYLINMVDSLDDPDRFNGILHEHKSFAVCNLLEQKLNWMLEHLRKQVAV